MHLVVVLVTMAILPLASILIERFGSGGELWLLIGKWFVFWGVGVRLFIAGVRQVLRPDLTATGIFGVTDRAAFPLAQELGFWNLTIGALGIATILRPAWLPPLALAAAGFYVMAGIKHVLSGNRNFEANTAMVSDLGLAAVLLCYLVATLRNTG